MLSMCLQQHHEVSTIIIPFYTEGTKARKVNCLNSHNSNRIQIQALTR